MSFEQALMLIALLLALWAIHWARRAANASERAAAAAEKSALAADRSALATKRWAESTTVSPAMVAAAAPEAAPPSIAGGDVGFDALVKELMEIWPQAKTALPFIEHHPELSEDQVKQIVERAFYFMGRDDAEAKQHAVAVLNFHRDQRVHQAEPRRRAAALAPRDSARNRASRQLRVRAGFTRASIERAGDTRDISRTKKTSPR